MPKNTAADRADFAFLHFTDRNRFSKNLIPSRIIMNQVIHCVNSDFFEEFLRFFAYTFDCSNSCFFTHLCLSPKQNNRNTFPKCPGLFLILIQYCCSVSLLTVLLIQQKVHNSRLAVHRNVHQHLHPDINLQSPVQSSLHSPPVHPDHNTD